MAVKCGKDGREMQSNGTLTILNKTFEKFECPECHGIVRLEVK